MGQCTSASSPEKEPRSKSNKPIEKNLLDNLLQHTKFTEKEIKEWYAAFMQAVPSGKITYDRFSELILRTVFRKKHGPEFVDVNAENLMHHVDLSFRQIDTNSDRLITFREFMIGMSRATKGTVEEKITYAFSLYDIDKDGTISITEMEEILMLVEKAYGNTNGGPRSQAEMDKFVKFIFNYLDTNQDGVISVTEFISGVKTEPELLDYLTGATDTLVTINIEDLEAEKNNRRRKQENFH